MDNDLVTQLQAENARLRAENRRLKQASAETLPIQEKPAWEAQVNAALAEVSRSLLARMTVDDMAYRVLEHAKRLTGSPYGFVGHIDTVTGYLVTSTLSRDIWDACRVKDKTVVFKEFKGLWGWVLNHRQSLMINDPSADPRSSGVPHGHIPIGRFVGAPALAGATLAGIIALANGDRDYTERDLALVERLADLYALALQRGQMEETVLEKEELFAAFMDYLPAVAFIKDQQSRHVYVNQYLRDHFKAADWLGKTSEDVFPAEVAQGLMLNDQKALAEGLLEFEETVEKADGETRSFQTLKFPIRIGQKPPLLGGIAIDITERKRVQDALQASELKYRRLHESLQDGFASTDLAGCILEFNPAFQQMVGYSEDELYRKTYPDLTPECWHAYEREIVETQVLQKGYSAIYEKEYRRKDGTIFPVELRTKLLWDETGQPCGLWAIVRDISERKRVEAALRAREEEFRTLVGNIPGAVYRCELEAPRRVHHISDGVQSITGHAAAEFIGNTVRYGDLILPADMAGVEQVIADTIVGRHPYDIEYRVRHRDDGIRWVQERGRVITDSSGQPVFLDGVIFDITERRRAEEELRHYRERLEEMVSARTSDLVLTNRQLLLEAEERQRAEDALRQSQERLRLALLAAQAGAWEWNINTNATTWSEENYRVMGLAPDSCEPTYKHWLRAVHPDDREAANAYVAKVVEQRSDLDFAMRMVWPDGTIRWVQDIGKILYDAEGQPDRMIGILIDITERKQAEADLERYRDHLEALVLKRTVDLESANVLLKQEIREREVAEEKIKTSLQEKEVLLKEIHHRVKNNLQVITSLLDLQADLIEDRTTRGKFRESRDRVRSMALIHERLYRAADLASIDIADYVKSVAHSLFSSYSAASRAITLQLDIEPMTMSIERAVPCGLIINELITNALKYAFPNAEPGVIGIELRALTTRQIVMLIWDNGVGLPADIDLHQLNSLGLTIVSTLVKQLRGTLSKESGQGTRFKLTFEDPSMKTAHYV